MLYDITIDLNEATTNTQDLTKYKSVLYKNVSDTSVIEIPSNVIEICFEGHLTEYTIPNHVKQFSGDNLGLEKLTLNEGLEWLYCRQNKLTTICLTTKLFCVDLEDNELETITTSGPLTDIQSLSIRNNKIINFDLILPHGMFEFNIGGNKGIRIKYLDFIFNCDENDHPMSLIDGDYKWILGDGVLMNSEYAFYRVAQYCYSGRKYIDLDEVNRRDGP
jgi:hypothetical protein